MSTELLKNVLVGIEEVARHIGRYDPPNEPNYVASNLSAQADVLRRVIAEAEKQEPVVMAQVYRCKIKSRKQIDREIPREKQGWWADVAAGQRIRLREATQADLDRCVLNEAHSKNPVHYMCETHTGGSLVSKMALEYMHPEQNVFVAIGDTHSQSKAEQEPVAIGLAQEVIGCFRAAEIEGLNEALAETTDERLKDLVQRRLLYALHAAESCLQPEQEPVAWMSGIDHKIVGKVWWSKECVPLYTTPQQRKPLTDEQINAIWNARDLPEHQSKLSAFGMDRVRAIIKAAHGIKE